MQGLRKVSIVVVILGLLFGSVSVYAITLGQLEQKIKYCAAINNDTARLEAYDALAESLNLVPPPLAGDKGNWLVSFSTDPMDDSKVVVLKLQSISGAKSFLGQPIKFYLILQYKNNKTEVYIDWGENFYFGAGNLIGNLIDVTWRVGAEKAKTDKWHISSDGRSTFYPHNSIALIKKLLTANRFVARLTPLGESPITAIFELRGLKNAIIPLRNVAGW